MSCHSFLRAVRYGNIIIGVYIGGSGSTEPVCVRPARKADEKLQQPVPLSHPRERRSMPDWAPQQADWGACKDDWDKRVFGKKKLSLRISGIIYLMH